MQPFSHSFMHTVVRTIAVLPATPVDFGDFSGRVCHVMKITSAESNSNMGRLTRQIFCFSPDVLVRANKIPLMTMSAASDQSYLLVSVTIIVLV